MSEKDAFQKFTLNPCWNFPWDDGIGKEGQVENLYEFCLKVGFAPQRLIQIGAANDLEPFEFMPFVERGMEALLIEPEPTFYRNLVKRFGHIPGINIMNVGIHEKEGKYRFVNRWASTTLIEFKDVPYLLDKPVDENKDTFFESDCVTFDQIDDGSADIVLLDCESSEWFCLKKMKSRPKILCIETFGPSKYKNPFLVEIFAWCTTNLYVLAAYNQSDSVMVRLKEVVM